MHFTYCPDCGHRLIEKEIGDEGLVPYCEHCRKPWFDMFSTCIIALVVNEFDEALLLKQDYISTEYCNLISGYMKPGERAEETAVREIEEETGVKVGHIQLAGTKWFAKKGLLMIAFTARARKSNLQLSPEVDAAAWVPVGDAIKRVHPKGSLSYMMIENYINHI